MASKIFAMPAASTALLLTFAFGLTNAMPWAGPQETKVYRGEDFSPKPTGAPVEPARLFKRDSVPVNVCGWIGGRPESVARCGSGSSCIHDTIHQVLGCCATAGACTDGVYTTCLDSGMEGWESTQGLINNGVLSCKASSTCYQNNFPGKYKQFGCGDSTSGADVQTSYEGQGKDMRLQVVYTGINFSPMSKLLYTTVPFDNPSTSLPEAGIANPTATNAATGGVSGKDDTTGYIAGGTVGGVALIAIVVAGIILLLRRRKIRNGQRVGGFVSLDHEEKPPTSGPFQRLTGRYSGHDFGPIARRSTAQEIAYMSPSHDGTTYVSPLTGHPKDSHAPYNIPHERDPRSAANMDRDMISSPLSASTYNGAFPDSDAYDTATAVPISRLNIHNPQPQYPHTQLIAAEEQQRQPLVGVSMDEFGHNWQQQHAQNHNLPLGYGGLGQQQNTHIHSGDMPEGTDMGLVSAMRRAASHMVTGNSRTIDPNLRSESFRHSKAEAMVGGSHALDFEDSIWKSQALGNGNNMLATPESLGLRTSNSSSMTLVGTDNGKARERDGASTTSAVSGGALMEQMMEAFNAATRVGGEPSVVVKKDVYQLVDEGVPSSSSENQNIHQLIPTASSSQHLASSSSSNQHQNQNQNQNQNFPTPSAPGSSSGLSANGSSSGVGGSGMSVVSEVSEMSAGNNNGKMPERSGSVQVKHSQSVSAAAEARAINRLSTGLLRKPVAGTVVHRKTSGGAGASGSSGDLI